MLEKEKELAEMLHRGFICKLQVSVGQTSPFLLQLPPRLPAHHGGEGRAFHILGPIEMDQFCYLFNKYLLSIRYYASY